ncbi:MAG: hypothetical protein VB082_10180 [Christensenella sp.]|nr:hypothetical protein [Christensenella sp.]
MGNNSKNSYAQSAYGNKWGMQTKSEAESRRQEEERRRKEEEARRRAEERRKKEEEARQKREEATRQQNSVKNSTNKVYTHEEYTKEQNQKSYGSDVYGSVDKPKYGGAKKNTPQSLFGTPGMKPGNPFGVPGAIKQPDDADRIMYVLESDYVWGDTKKDAGMDNAGYANDVYGSVNHPKYGSTAAKKPQALPRLTPLGKDELTPEQEKVFLDTLFEVPEKSDPIPTYGPKGETKEEKTMRELIGYLTEDGYQPETPQEYAKRLAEEKQQQAAMNNAGYANDVYGSADKPRYGGTVAKKPQALPGLTPGGAQTGNAFSLPQTPGAAENIMGGSTLNSTGMVYNKNNPEKMTKNGINSDTSAYIYNKGQNGTVNMSDMQASSVTAKQQNAGYEQAPEELKRMYDILGEGDTGKGISFEGIQKSFGREMDFEMDEQGNVIGDYRQAFEQRINEQYPQATQEEKNDLLEGTLLFIKAEFGKQNADPEKILDVTENYQKMLEETSKNPFWPFELVGFGPFKGQYYLKDDPKIIKDLCGDQIPHDIMEEAIAIGGEKGVNYLMQQGYGYFKVGGKIMNAEELGNYSLGIIATAKGYSRGNGYFAANSDRWKMGGSKGGEIYDKYFQTMGMDDAATWQ